MTTSSINRIIDTVKANASGLLDGTLRLELFTVFKEFFRRTDAWQLEVEVYALPGITDYDIPALANALVQKLIWLEGPRSALSVSNPNPVGSPKTAWLDTPSVRGTRLKVASPPAQDETWYAHVTLGVADPTTTEGVPYAPDEVVELYFDGLMSGLLSKVLMHPNKPYSNDRLAMFHGRKFNDCMNSAKRDKARGFVVGGQAWAYPQGFRSRMQRTW